MNNKDLKQLIKIFEASSLSRMRLDKGDVTIELEKQHASMQTAQPAAPVISVSTPASVNNPDPVEAPNTYDPVKAPLVGTYYEAPAPDQPPFVRLGQTVKKGDTLFIIEAMKVMNEITAPRDGKIARIHAKNAEMVMYDQTVMELE